MEGVIYKEGKAVQNWKDCSTKSNEWDLRNGMEWPKTKTVTKLDVIDGVEGLEANQIE